MKIIQNYDQLVLEMEFSLNCWKGLCLVHRKLLKSIQCCMMYSLNFIPILKNVRAIIMHHQHGCLHHRPFVRQISGLRLSSKIDFFNKWLFYHKFDGVVYWRLFPCKCVYGDLYIFVYIELYV